MANDERYEEAQESTKDLDNLDVVELEDEDIEDASGGATSTGNNFNCGC